MNDIHCDSLQNNNAVKRKSTQWRQHGVENLAISPALIRYSSLTKDNYTVIYFRIKLIEVRSVSYEYNSFLEWSSPLTSFDRSFSGMFPVHVVCYVVRCKPPRAQVRTTPSIRSIALSSVSPIAGSRQCRSSFLRRWQFHCRLLLLRSRLLFFLKHNSISLANKWLQTDARSSDTLRGLVTGFHLATIGSEESFDALHSYLHSYLVKHDFDITQKCHWFLPKPCEDTDQGIRQVWSLE